MLYCFAQSVCCDFTTEDPEALKEHEDTAHPIKYKMVGRRKYGRIGYINIFEKVED